jgi:hypothetical protein
MDQTCLEFFQARSTEPLELVLVKKGDVFIEFKIQNQNDMCIFIRIEDNLSFMNIYQLKKCSLSGTQSITSAIDFAREQCIQTVKLADTSEIKYYVSGKMFPIPLKELSMLSSGYTWYESFGFRNGFEQYRDRWIECIHQPFHELYETVEKHIADEHNALLDTLSNYAEDGPIDVIFKQIRMFLKKCPKEANNQCDGVLETDLIFLHEFIKKSFELLMMVVLHVTHAELYDTLYLYSFYSLPLYFSNETWVHSFGTIGKVVGIQPGYYRIEFSDGIKEVPIPQVKRLNKVLLHGVPGVPNTKVKIVDRDREGYLVEWEKTTRMVPFENIKVLGGRKTKRRVWNQSLRSVRNR